MKLGGQHYMPAGGVVRVALEVSRSSSGHAFHLRLTTGLEGPCMRCLEEAAVTVDVDSREIHLPGSGDEELSSPYVEGDVLNLGAWAHDALVLAAPVTLLCRPDCAGLCPVCGVSLNDADPADHRHAEPTGPFAGLGELLGE
jgi:uncharacterized protein